MIHNLTREVKRHSNLARRKGGKQANERAPKQLESHPCDTRGYFRDLLEALPTAIYTTDANGRITFLIRPPSSSRAHPRNRQRSMVRYLAPILAGWSADGARRVPDGQGFEGRPVDPR